VSSRATRDAGAESAASVRRSGPAPEEVHRRQREEFGGLSWGSAFFGWLVAVGVSALLIALLSAAGAAVGLTETSADEAASSAETVGIVGGIVLLAILMLAYYAGGYVAGRMARFNGPRQGVATWLIGLIVTVVLAVAGVLLGAEYNVLSSLNLPRIPVDEGSLTTGGLIALAAVLVGTLLAAVAGGKAGTHYHRKVDRVGH
jgi:amino acid transporter